MTAPRFEIVRFVARYDDRDCIVGWAGRRIAVAETQAWAHVLADREDYDHDVYAEVREIATGKRVRRYVEAPAIDLPF
jgi:hypothetical protein